MGEGRGEIILLPYAHTALAARGVRGIYLRTTNCAVIFDPRNSKTISIDDDEDDDGKAFLETKYH